MIFYLLIFLIISIQSTAQSINISAKENNNKIDILYSLNNVLEKQPYKIEIFYSLDGGVNYSTSPLITNTGQNHQIINGSGIRKITWDILDELDLNTFNASSLTFKVNATPISPYRKKSLKNGETVEDPCGIKMVFIKGGSFNMGNSDPKALEDEKPVHEVLLDDFFISKYEITQSEWEYITNKKPNNLNDCNNCPLTQISWNNVQKFIEELNYKTGYNYRLPTEAEWEYAAKGGDPFNKSIFDITVANDTISFNESKNRNKLGLYGMNSSVWEWCNDWYSSNYYSNSSKSNPIGPKNGASKVVRGGSINVHSIRNGTTFRRFYGVNIKNNFIGFRLVRD